LFKDCCLIKPRWKSRLADLAPKLPHWIGEVEMDATERPENVVSGEARQPFTTLVITTPNLTLRAFGEEDIDPLYTIMADPVANQYTYIAPSQEHCVERLHAYAEQASTLGYASWTVLLRASGEVIGWGGINIDPFDSGWGIEVAYCFAPAHWGKGYATELVRAALEYGFGALAIPTLVAFAHQDNIGSRRVLEKCGFRLLGYEPRLDRNHYALEQAEWLAAGNVSQM
jgi:RimJ/RimL family protein N-acetyltransferase